MISGKQGLVDEARAATLIIETASALDRVAPQNDCDLYDLGGRELECLGWSAEGKSSDEIAIILGLSPYTINGYLKSAMYKLNTFSRIQAVAKASRLGLI
ncbi:MULTISPECIES: helix-turn-helix transcriptional regulator [unclassified Rhizobium]|uniref:helix-turn-helix transcriptional regulator n=1 Tax=unclassified Rhizobium TaxID=2613769 RepID=UPI002987FEB3|nr:MULTISPECIES: helix-turn-helix transcriptional regulator [unclassified Rhizobium]